MAAPLRVPLIAEACNPTGTGVPRVGYTLARALTGRPEPVGRDIRAEEVKGGGPVAAEPVSRTGRRRNVIRKFSVTEPPPVTTVSGGGGGYCVDRVPDYARLLEAMRAAVAGRPGDPAFRTALGAVLVRAGPARPSRT